MQDYIMQMRDNTDVIGINVGEGDNIDPKFVNIMQKLNQDRTKNDKEDQATTTTVADIVGEFGYYQLSIALLTLVRYIVVAMMTNTGPLIAPEVEFSCNLPSTFNLSTIQRPESQTLSTFLINKCNFNLISGDIYTCDSWTFNTTAYGKTLTDSFDLVCDRNWLRSASQSIVSIGVVLASVIWGSFSDRQGRLLTIQVCFTCSLLSGAVSYLATNYIVYTIARAICSFGDLGLCVSLATIIVELLGNKYRSTVCATVYTGWSIGVMIMPWLTAYFRDYGQLMLFTVVCHVLTLPWILTINESVRWLLVNGQIDKAHEELQRISSWNSKSDKESLQEVDRKFDILKIKFLPVAEKMKIEREEEKAKGGRLRSTFLLLFGGLSKVNQLFQAKELLITTVTLVWISFNTEFLYMFFIMINSDIGTDIKLNYAIGGVMETLATIFAILMLAYSKRKFSLISILTSIAALCFVLALTHQQPVLSVWVLNLTKLAISTLSSLIYVVVTEVFPTNIRQTGFGITGTLGSLGAVLAPFVRTELTNSIGMTNVMFITCSLPITAALLIPFFLRETKGIELPDDIDDLTS